MLFSLFISQSLTQPSASSIHKVDIIMQVQLLLPCYQLITILLNVKKTLTLCFAYLLCYCILVNLFFCCMFETKSFGKQQTLLRICMIIQGVDGDEDGETRLSSKSILQPKSTIKVVHVAKIEAFACNGCSNKNQSFWFPFHCSTIIWAFFCFQYTWLGS